MIWVSSLDGGPRRVNHASVAISDFIYSFGGYCSGEDYRSSRSMDVHVLNTFNLRWTLLPIDKNLKYPKVPFQRYGHTAVAYDYKVYIFGGRNDDMVCDILFCFNTKTQQWERPEVSGNLPGARDGHSACIVGHKMYIFGGFEEMMDQFSCDVHCLDLKTMQWSFVYTSNSPPSFRDFHTASVINNERMYIFGGRGDVHAPYHSQNEIYCPKIVYLDLDTLKWVEPDNVTGVVPTGRRSHSAFVYQNMIFVFGGYNGLLDLHFNDLHCFDPSRNVWSLVKTQGTSPKARRRQSCIVIDTKMYLFGGTCPISANTNPVMNPASSQQLIDYNDTHVLDFQPSLKTLCIFTVVQNSLNLSELPQDIIYEIKMMQQANSISRPLTNTG